MGFLWGSGERPWEQGEVEYLCISGLSVCNILITQDWGWLFIDGSFQKMRSHAVWVSPSWVRLMFAKPCLPIARYIYFYEEVQTLTLWVVLETLEPLHCRQFYGCYVSQWLVFYWFLRITGRSQFLCYSLEWYRQLSCYSYLQWRMCVTLWRTQTTVT